MAEVRRHKRKTASGKTVTVRHHTRDVDAAQRDDPGEQAREAWADRVESSAPHVSTLRPPEPAQPDGFWDDSEEQPAGDWWAGDEVEHEGHTFKVNRAPAYKPQGDYDFAKDEPARPADKAAALARYKSAKRALAANAEYEQAHGIDYETPEYERLNHEYNEALKDVPWWRR